MKQIELPYNFNPSTRPFQAKIWNDVRKNKLLVIPRRHGKTSLALNWLIVQAICNPNKVYWYICPTQKQAKEVVWKAPDMINVYLPPEAVDKKNEVELTIYLKNGSQICIKGGDEPDNLRGTNPFGVVIDEYAQIKKEIYDEILLPILKVNGGWIWLIGCVTKDTMVLAEDGLEEIGESPLGYVEENKRVYGLNGWHEAVQRFGNPKLPTIKIKTAKGFQIEATPNHRLWTLEEWKSMDSFRSGDLVAIQRGQNVYGKIDIDKDFAYFLGLYMAEGNVEPTIYRITISNTDKEIIDYLKDKFNFNCKDGVHSRRNSKVFYQKLSSYFQKTKAKFKTIPKEVFSWNKESQCYFLRGYFDGDGSADLRGRVSCTSSSERLIQQIQLMLLNMGIVASKSQVLTPITKRVKVESMGYRLCVDGINARKYFALIGSMLPRKQSRVAYTKPKRIVGDYVPFDLKEFKNGKPLSAKWGNLINIKNISYVRLGKLLKDFPNTKYQKIFDDWFLYDKIVSIENSEAETFDFVIPETHSYFSNGFISHNTPKGKNDFYQKFLQFQCFPDWQVMHIKASQSNVLPVEILADAKQNMTEKAFNQEFECEFHEGAGSIFRRITENATAQPADPQGGSYQMGVDLARHVDFTVISVIDTKTHKQVFLDRFNQIDWNLQMSRIEAIARRYNNARINIDSSGVGDPIALELKQRGLDVIPFTFTSSIKNALIQNLALLLEQDKIKIIPDEVQIQELSNYTFDTSPNGNIRYNAPVGQHDDTVIALALAVYDLPARFAPTLESNVYQLTYNAYGEPEY
jgi:intein/homing endonuclease